MYLGDRAIYHIAAIFAVVNFHVTVNECITELIRGFNIRAMQVHACTAHAHTHTWKIFAPLRKM